MFGLGKDKTVQEGLYALSIAIVIASVIVSFSIIYAANTIAGKDMFATGNSTNQDIQEENAPQQTPEESETVEVSVDDDPAIGSNNAKVTMILFSEFQCPFSGRFARDTFPQIKTDYIDTGKVKLVYRDFVVHSTSQKAQEAAECANEQGKFWEMHDLLYQNQGALETDDLKGYASQLGLNTESFDSCLDSGKYESEVQKDTEDGRNYGVTGTPTFFINGKKFVGAQAYEKFKAEIEEALAA
jgi:protein-disulfide isomerase